MRIVSQNKEVDIPYSEMSIYVENKIIYASFNFFRDKILGTYSSKEKALKVMEMIRKQNINFKSWELDRFSNEDSPLTTYFYMPQDDEVEI